MLYRLTPSLIEQGYVYIAESPLFEITVQGLDAPLFAWSDRDKDEIVAAHSGKRCTVMRSKGLGENEPDMMWLTTMSPETRRLIKVTPTTRRRPRRCSTFCWATTSRAERDFIADNGYKYLDDVDLS